MAYEIKYTDFTNKGSIVVEDQSINQDTTLDFPGKRSTAYGQAIAENFLHLLENFASANAPLRPVEGQMWYDTSAGENQLKIYDGTGWVTASGIKKSTTEPITATSLVGDLWIDTRNQQLFLYNGNDWVLVGPESTGGTLTGTKAITILDTADIEETVFVIYVQDVPVLIVSNTTNKEGWFVPKRSISGFSRINKGVTISNNYQFFGVVESANNLIINGSNVPSNNFIRSDIESTLNNRFNIRSNQGIRIGEASQLEVSLNEQTVEIKHNVSGSAIDFILRDQTRFNTVLRIDSQKTIGINNPAPEESLDVKGNIRISPLDGEPFSGNLIIDSTVNSIDIDSGSIITDGGIGVAQDAVIGGNISVLTTALIDKIEPFTTDQSGSGYIGTPTKRFRELNVTNINATNIDITGNIVGNLEGSATNADRLTNPISLTFAGGDVSGSTGNFDGSSAISDIKLSISNEFIASKTSINNVSATDQILINKVDTSDGSETGVYKVSKANFLKTIPTIPVGSIMPYGGYVPPTGWLICDGSVVKKVDFNKLWQVIQHNFRDPVLLADLGVSTYALPDFRGRAAIGIDGMGSQGLAGRVPTAADIGNTGGSSEVTLAEENLPEHEHDIQGDDGSQYYAIRTGSPDTAPVDAEILNYETGNQGTQGIASSGGIKTNSSLGQPIDVMNPFLAITYIIYAGE